MSSSLKTPAIHSGDLEFIIDRADNLRTSLEGSSSSAVVGGMTHNRLPSLHAILKESPNDNDSASSEGESSGSPLPRACNTVTYVVPVATMSPPEETPVFQTLPTRLQRTTAPTPFPEPSVARQEERRRTPQDDIE
jgi:hypothetical protein